MVYSKVKQANLFVMTQKIDSVRIREKAICQTKWKGGKGNEVGVKKRKREKSLKNVVISG